MESKVTIPYVVIGDFKDLGMYRTESRLNHWIPPYKNLSKLYRWKVYTLGIL